MSDQELVELAQDVDVRCRLRGDFVVRSGAVTREYFDKYLERARIGQSGVGLGRVVSDLLEREGREFRGEFA